MESQREITKPVEGEERDARTLPGQPCRVLVVDDNADAAGTLAMLLELHGHTTREAGDGPAALATAAEFQPQMILLDIGLPGMDGYEVARKLRASPVTRSATLIALTGYGREEDRQLSLVAGFDHHLVKPADPATLLALIAAHCKGDEI
jgi:CheY-like chemotaxis protein